MIPNEAMIRAEPPFRQAGPLTVRLFLLYFIRVCPRLFVEIVLLDS
jgi:hypothetical protein